MKTGEILVNEGYVRAADVKKALEIQKENRRGRNLSLIGEILCSFNVISSIDLFSVLHKNNRILPLGDIFIRNKVVTEAQIEKALHIQRRKPELLGNILIEEEAIALKDLYYALSIQGNVPFLELNNFQYLKKIKNVLSKIAGTTFVKSTGILPITYEKETLTFAISTPYDMNALFNYSRKNNRFRINCALIDSEKHYELLGSFLDNGLTKDIETGLLKRKKMLREKISLNKNSHHHTEDQSPLKVALNVRYELSDLLTEGAKIDGMYAQYKKLKRLAGGTSEDFDGRLFKDFIRQNHEIIQKKYKCQRVLYYFEPRGEKIIIQALPSLN